LIGYNVDVDHTVLFKFIISINKMLGPKPNMKHKEPVLKI
jgi:hypothetical protein